MDHQPRVRAKTMLKALIIDDEPLAHEVIKHHLNTHADIQLVGQCTHATEALHFLAENEVDLMFLDINMPVLSGMDMLKVLKNKPQVIVVSAYSEFALEGYELDVTDYLMKPVGEERLARALAKVRERLGNKSTDDKTVPSIVVKVDREKRKLEIDSITVLEAFGNYVKLWQGDSMLLVSSTLRQLIEQLPQNQFVQVHKSFVVNTAQVTGVDKDHVRMQGDQLIKVGKMYKSGLRDLL